MVEQRIPTASPVRLIPVESEAPLTKQHEFRFLQPRADGGLFARVGEGVKAPGGFETNTRFDSMLKVPEFPKETRILGKGNILALDGERKLAVQSRAVDHLRITLGRVPVSQFQHLITQSSGKFEELAFFNGYEQNIVQRWSKIVAVRHKNDWEAVRSVVDVSQAPPLTAPDQLPGGRGVFFVTVEGVSKDEADEAADDIYSRIDTPSDASDDDDSRGFWYYDEETEPKDGWKREEGAVAKRFIMATDLGLLVKAASDGTRDIDVMALGAGQPVAD